jgi:hypothetical protein
MKKREEQSKSTVIQQTPSGLKRRTYALFTGMYDDEPLTQLYQPRCPIQKSNAG